MQNKEITISAKQFRNRTLFSFSIFLVLLIAVFFAWRWIHKQPNVDGTPAPLRTVLNSNERFFNNLFSNKHLAKSYPTSAAVKNVRVNGNAGMSANFDPATWKLQVVRSAGDTLFLSMDDIKALPKSDVVFDFKCIEGWSQVTWWGGVKFSDFAEHYGLNAQTQMKYIGLVTPDKKYYVGIDMPSIMHPQTILAYEMNGAPLPMNQGFPLRLIIPVKYGIKHLKRIGTINFSNERPPDYWYERGYDYYSGL